jgi:hypothetical protein
MDPQSERGSPGGLGQTEVGRGRSSRQNGKVCDPKGPCHVDKVAEDVALGFSELGGGVGGQHVAEVFFKVGQDGLWFV